MVKRLKTTLYTLAITLIIMKSLYNSLNQLLQVKDWITILDRLEKSFTHLSRILAYKKICFYFKDRPIISFDLFYQFVGLKF